MKCKIETIDCEEPLGERVTIFDDVTVWEMEVDSLDDVADLLDVYGEVIIEESAWDRYDANVTVVCRDR